LAGIPNNRYVIRERREQVAILLSQSRTEVEIAKSLKVNQSTVSRDITAIKKESQQLLLNIAKETLPYEYGKSLLCMNRVIRECWSIFEDKSERWTNKDKLNALRLAKEATMSRVEILFNGPVTLEVQHFRDKLDKLIAANERGYGELYPREIPLQEEPPPM
jgi:hypothetical protein